MPLTTKFTILSNFFCISRPHLIENRKTRLICEAIFITIAIIVTATVAIDIFDSDIMSGIRVVQALTGLELIWIAVAARLQIETSKSLERLDEKCPLSEEDVAKLNDKTQFIAALSVVSFIFDFIGLKAIQLKNTSTLFLCVAFAAHDAELAYFTLLVEKLIVRLQVLKSISPNLGSRAYGYLLSATSHLSEQFTSRLLLLLGTALFTTVIYQFFLILADAETILYLLLFIIWREIKSMYSLYLMCSAISRSDNLCKELALHLIGRLTMDKDLYKNQNQYRLVERWYSVVITQQPRYTSGTNLSISLSTPILVIDLSINYMLIIVQMYQAYK